MDNAKLLSSAPAGERGENVAYYFNKLDDLYANYRPFLPEEKTPLGL